MLFELLFVWISIYLYKFYLKYSQSYKNIIIKPFYLSYETINSNTNNNSPWTLSIDYFIRNTYLKITNKIIFKCGAIIMCIILIISPFLLIELLSNMYLSTTSYLVMKDDHSKDTISSLIVPLVPFLNIPQSYLFSFWTATVISSFIHEIGHSIAAIYDDIRIEKVGIFVMIVFPGAYVHLENSIHKLDIWPKLKIYAAGISFNMMFAILSYIILQCLPILLFFIYKRSSGVVITSIFPHSSLQHHLYPGMNIKLINGQIVGSNQDYKDVLTLLHKNVKNTRMNTNLYMYLLSTLYPPLSNSNFTTGNNSTTNNNHNYINKYTNLLGINTGYCVHDILHSNNNSFNENEIIGNNTYNLNNKEIIIDGDDDLLDRQQELECCMQLFMSPNTIPVNINITTTAVNTPITTSSTSSNILPERDCFIHTSKEWSSSSAVANSTQLLCRNIHEIYNPSLTNFKIHCNVDTDCSDGGKCIKMITKFNSQLLVIETYIRDIQKVFFFIGSPQQLIIDTKVSSYRLRGWLYSILHIDQWPWFYNQALHFRGNIVMYLKLLVQMNLSTALLNSLPIIHLDGGLILPHLLKIYLPKNSDIVSNIIIYINTGVIILVSIVGLWPLLVRKARE